MLKGVVTDELDTLGQRLEELETKDRLEVFIKLLPFVLPKTQSIAQKKGEGFEVHFNLSTPLVTFNLLVLNVVSLFYHSNSPGL